MLLTPNNVRGNEETQQRAWGAKVFPGEGLGKEKGKNLLGITVKYNGISGSIAVHHYNADLCPKPVTVYGASS